jgi:uncharacterized protein (TIGR02996 family)
MKEEDLLETIRAAPDEDAPRLVYADWLLERDDARGELIQIECQLARGATGAEAKRLENRAQVLHEAHDQAWQAPAREIGGHYYIRRGLPEELSVPLATFLARPNDVLARFFLRLNVHHATALRVAQLARLPVLARLTHLSISSNVSHQPVSTQGAKALAASPNVTKLVWLKLEGCGIGPLGVKALTQSPNLTALRSLDLSNNDVNVKGVQALVSPKSCLRLERLLLDRSVIDDACCAALAAWPGLASLRYLAVRDSRVTAAGAAALRASPHAHPSLKLALLASAMRE